jgi:hypothetical protein
MLLVAAVAVVGRIYRERTRLLSCDEVYTAFAVTDPSFSHMLGALRDEINAMPPLSFVLGWGLTRVIGVSEIALRLPSAVFGLLGIVFLWLCLRRSLNRWVATWCAVCLPLASDWFVFSSTEARCYSLYFAAYVAAVGLYLRCAEDGAMAKREPWLVTIAHGILVAVHYVGGLFSALLVTVSLVAGFLWPTYRHRYNRYALHGAIGWLAVIPSLPFYLAQRRLGAELNWLPRPKVSDLYEEMISGIGTFSLFVMALLVWALVAEGRRGAVAIDSRRTLARTRSIALLMVAGQVFLVAAWVESRLASNIFSNHYLFLVSVALMIAIAFVADSLVARLWWGEASPAGDQSGSISRFQNVSWRRWLVVSTAGVLAIFVGLKLLLPRESIRVQVEALRAMNQHPDVPVVTSGTHEQVELGWYRPTPGGVVLLNDRHYHGPAIGIACGMALDRHYLPGSMKSLPECVEAFDSFIYVNPLLENVDVEAFLATQPGWRSTSLGPHTTFWERGEKPTAE